MDEIHSEKDKEKDAESQEKATKDKPSSQSELIRMLWMNRLAVVLAAFVLEVAGIAILAVSAGAGGETVLDAWGLELTTTHVGLVVIALGVILHARVLKGNTKLIASVLTASVIIVFAISGLTHLLPGNRTESVTIDHEGLTLKTPIGITDVTYRKSQSSDYSILYPEGKFVNYANDESKYAISYPRNSIWKDISYLGPEWLQKFEQLPGFSKAIYAPGQNDLIAMVTVRVYWAGNLTIQEALMGFEQAAGEGVSYSRPSIDQLTNSATLPGYDKIGDKIMVSRVILINGWLYDLRAMISPNASSKINEEMNIIVNSFHMLY